MCKEMKPKRKTKLRSCLLLVLFVLTGVAGGVYLSSRPYKEPTPETPAIIAANVERMRIRAENAEERKAQMAVNTQAREKRREERIAAERAEREAKKKDEEKIAAFIKEGIDAVNNITPEEKAELEQKVQAAQERMKTEKAEAARKYRGRMTCMNTLRTQRGQIIKMTHEVISKYLKAPATADFAPAREVSITIAEDNTLRVETWVDAENSFGAKLRTRFIARFRLEGQTLVLIGLEDL